MQPGFDNGLAARRLEKIQERQDFIVHGQRQIVRDILGGLLGPVFQPRVHGKGHFRHFINRRRNRRGFLESVSGPECLQFVGVYGVHHAVEELAQLRIAVRVVTALQQPIDRVIEIAARRVQMAGFEILFARRKFFLDLDNQKRFAVGNGWKKRRWNLPSRAPDRQRSQHRRNLLGRGGLRGRVRFALRHGRMPRCSVRSETRRQHQCAD